MAPSLSAAPLDRHARPVRNLRISVTDRCNLRCGYCMPEEAYTWLPRRSILDFEEIVALVEAFVAVGVERVRLTGGEPLLRRDLPELVRQLAAVEGLRDLALTTNGLKLAEHAAALREAGLHRVTVSLDTLREDRFLALTRREGLADVLAGLEAARAAGFTGTKIDTVVLRGTNDDELADLLEHARGVGAELRFIEYMDVGGATAWSHAQVVSRDEILARLGERYGPIEPQAPTGDDASAPADRYRLPAGAGGDLFGIIASTTAPFCARCDRSRLTADGRWFLCLYATGGRDLGAMLRGGASREELAATIRRVWCGRDDRGAEARLAEAERGSLADAAALRDNPHLEMHKRGG